MVGNKNPLPTLQDIIFWINGGQQKPVTHPTGYYFLDKWWATKTRYPPYRIFLGWWATKTRYPPYRILFFG
ncbi:MAG: hypothetical protein DRR16_03320 [Candidatus Parabeggiatoa sp. nov. 3]|nr:MAG: hypothetical protein DRQ99_23080 [Gammaproteobacteria bacterium]RKZ89096.1 MAG: hypothetical protein DRR16_03320 [Gammaproteobacteria bacterium]HEW98960.1 hypothetical protein [Beggiatoa sp.]